MSGNSKLFVQARQFSPNLAPLTGWLAVYAMGLTWRERGGQSPFFGKP